MANMIMASAKALLPFTPKLKPHPQIPQNPPTPLPPRRRRHLLPNSRAAFPRHIEKASLFDYNLTLPIIAVKFLFLMFALNKVYYSPLGKLMDERDAAIREKLNSVKDTSGEVKQLEAQAAMAEISAAMNKMKKEQ